MAIFVCLFLSFSCVFVCVHWNYSSNNQHQQQIPPQHTAPTSPRDESQQQQQNENTHRNLPSPAAAHPQPANANQDMDEDVAINQVCTLRIVNDRTNESENCKNLWNEWTIYFCFFAIKFIAFNSYIEKKELDVRWIELVFFFVFSILCSFSFLFSFWFRWILCISSIRRKMLHKTANNSNNNQISNLHQNKISICPPNSKINRIANSKATRRIVSQFESKNSNINFHMKHIYYAMRCVLYVALNFGMCGDHRLSINCMCVCESFVDNKVSARARERERKI